MCVAAVAWNAHPDWLFVCAGNRDEFHARQAAPLSRWTDGSGIIAGRDLAGGGTWMGISEAGRFALVTNVRVPEGPQAGRPTRGHLVTAMLSGNTPQDIAAMNAFNLIWINGGFAGFVTNHPSPEDLPLSFGIHGLSNSGFDVPWPKTLQVQRAVEAWMRAQTSDTTPLLDALRDERQPAGSGDIANGPEPRLASVFIRDDAYGTRCSTVIAVRRDGVGIIVERTYAPGGFAVDEKAESFFWPVPKFEKPDESVADWKP